MIKEFSKKTIDALKYYVYIYSDPDTGQIFYVGKGQGNRVFSHLNTTGTENDKVQKIREIQSRGKQPIIEILVHGIEDEQTALKVEAAAIDLIGIKNLTNLQRGHDSRFYGKIDVDTIDARYNIEELVRDDITENVMMIRINRAYKNNMSEVDLYDVTRCRWKVNLEQAKKIEFVFSVFQGMVMEVYQVAQWLPAYSTLAANYHKQPPSDNNDPSWKRYEFVGNIAPGFIRKKYFNKDVSQLFSPGAQNPIQYLWSTDIDDEN